MEGPSDLGRTHQFICDVARDVSILELNCSLDLFIEEIARLMHAEEDQGDLLQEAAEIIIDSLMTVEIRGWLREGLHRSLSRL